MTLEERFARLSAEDIERFIADGQEENLHLEFKTVGSADLKRTEDKQNLAKCMSGFANSNGGIIIWGVQANKDTDGVDRATARQHIKPLRLFLSRLNEL